MMKAMIKVTTTRSLLVLLLIVAAAVVDRTMAFDLQPPSQSTTTSSSSSSSSSPSQPSSLSKLYTTTDDNKIIVTPPGVFRGKVKWFDVKKGYGFITRDDDEQDFFVHQTAIQADGFRALQDGIQVEFQLSEDGGKDGKTSSAVQVTGPNGEQLKRGYAYKKRGE